MSHGHQTVASAHFTPLPEVDAEGEYVQEPRPAWREPLWDEDGAQITTHRKVAAWKPWMVEVNPQHRRKGLATAMYRHLESATGVPIKNGGVQSPEGKAFRARYNERFPRTVKSEPDEPVWVEIPAAERGAGGPTHRLAKAEDLDKAIADLPPGKPLARRGAFEVFDYSHLLPESHRSAGATLKIIQRPGPNGPTSMDAEVDHPKWGNNAGSVVGVLHSDKTITPHSKVVRPLQGQGVGRAAYQALFRHAMQYGYNQAKGHASPEAEHVHESIAREHGTKFQRTAFGDYTHTLKSEPLDKAIADIPAGTPTIAGGNTYDYGHVLPPEAKKAGYQLHATMENTRDGGRPGGDEVLRVKLYDPTRTQVGRVTGYMFRQTNEIEPNFTNLDPAHQGKGFGRAMYEALYAHAYHHHGVRGVWGNDHTNQAGAVHESLDRRHGTGYVAVPGTPTRGFPAEDRGPYRHALKTEPLGKEEPAPAAPMSGDDMRAAIRTIGSLLERLVPPEAPAETPVEPPAEVKLVQAPAPEVALVLAYDAAGRLLLGKRNDSGRYTLPGGHLDPGESPEDGARRELKEETGLEAHGLARVQHLKPNAPGGPVLAVYTALVAGTPHGGLDPDREVSEWSWHDVSGGLDPIIRSALHGPDDHTNVVRQLHPAAVGLTKTEPALLIKVQPTITFPSLGMGDDRRETPIVDTDHALKTQQRAILAHGARAMEAAGRTGDAATTRSQGPHVRWSAGTVSVSPGARTGFVMSTSLRRRHLESMQSDDSAAPMMHANNNSVIATKTHEDFHMMAQRLRDVHGAPAVRHMLSSLWDSVPATARAHAQRFIDRRMGMSPDHPHYPEERIALLHNYLNNPGERRAYAEYGGLSDAHLRIADQGIKQTMRHLRQRAAYVSKESMEDHASAAQAEQRMGKSEPLGKMAIANLPPGKKTRKPVTPWAPKGQSYNYDHLVPKGAPYTLRVHHAKAHDGEPLVGAFVLSNGAPVGQVTGVVRDGALDIGQSEMRPEHRGKGLGLAAYEALMAHAYHKLGVRKVAGGLHSTSADGVHAALARKHGLEYVSSPSDGDRPVGDNDGRFGSYRYELKSEPDFPCQTRVLLRAEGDGGDAPLLDHHDHRERALAVLAHRLTPRQIHRAARDPHPDVRAAALGHPDLTPAMLHLLCHSRHLADGRPVGKAVVDFLTHPHATKEHVKAVLGAAKNDPSPEAREAESIANEVGAKWAV